MTKYKFKIDTPWGKKGGILLSTAFLLDGRLTSLKPEYYPEIFEPIPEKTNKDKWNDILCEKLRIVNPDALFAVAVVLNDLGYNADKAYDAVFGGEK